MRPIKQCVLCLILFVAACAGEPASASVRATSTREEDLETPKGLLSVMANTDGFQGPTWPEKYITDWSLYHVLSEEPTPPYAGGKMPEPYLSGKGRTFYDWEKLGLREEYYDFCVPIFVDGYNFTCTFLNINNISYFMTFDDRPSWTPACCIFGKPWLPPSPGRLSKLLPFYRKEKFYDEDVDWYRTSPPTGLVFGYGYYADNGIPAEFFFNGQKGWALQDFANFTSAAPPAEKWVVPSACESAKMCDLPHYQRFG